MTNPSLRDVRIQGLDLTNIGGFETFSADFGLSNVVLVGANASGKTVLLEAIASALGVLFVRMDAFDRVSLIRPEQKRRLIREELGLVTAVRPTPVVVTMRVLLDGKSTKWTLTRRGYGSVHGTLGAAWGQEVEQSIGRGERVDLPVVAYYPTARVWTGQIPHEDTEIEQRLDAYERSLPATRSFKAVAKWMRRLAYAERQDDHPSVHLAALSAAVKRAVPELDAFYYAIKAEDVFVRFASGLTQPFQQLSDGYRNMVGLVADLAWRMLMLNPHLGVGAFDTVGGVVLIDEIDLHLHPGWQRKVLTGLTATFPKVQFIVTTHSPQVLASAKREWVRLLRPTAAVPVGPVEGRDSNSILVEVFGVGERDPSWQAEIDEVFQAIDREDFDAARTRLADLEAFWGAADPELVRARTMLSVLDHA